MKKVNEKQLQEVGIIFLVFFLIMIVSSCISRCSELKLEYSRLQDLHQQQEMIDYHRTQGREISRY